MSRSRRRAVKNSKHLYRSTVACVGPGTMKRWRTAYNRIIRAKNRDKINKLDLENLEEDDTVFVEDKNEIIDADHWGGPHDGYTLWDDKKDSEREPNNWERKLNRK